MSRRPHISANFAISADGKISPASGHPSGWTSPEDHRRLLALRAGADALIVARGTLETDRMTLTVPVAPETCPQPLRCVVSRAGRFDLSQPLFHTPGGAIHLLITQPHPGFDPAALLNQGASIHHGSLAAFLSSLHAGHGVRHLHCEGGGELLHELLAMDCVDTLHLTWAGHSLFGGHAAPTISGLPGSFLPASRHFDLTHFEPHPDLGECFLTYVRTR